MSFSVTMPALGESVTEGTVTRWLKSVGDTVAADEPLLEVSTDKVDTEIPSPTGGVLTQIVVGEDETVAVGTELAVIGEASDAAASQPATPAAAPTPPTEAPAPQPVASAPAPQAGSGTTVDMPALGESVTEGTVTRWLKGVGDPVAMDEPLLEVSTDKVDTEIPSPATGTLLSIAVGEDETVPVGTALAVIGSAAAPAPAAPPPAAPAPAAPAPPAAARAEPQTQATPAPGAPTPAGGVDENGAAYVTPLVRKLAAEHVVSLAGVTGTGVGGRIRKQDVLDAAAAAKTAATAIPAPVPAAASTPAAPAPTAVAASPLRGTTVKMTRLRKVIAARMVESLQTSAQLTTVTEVDITRVTRLRQQAKGGFEAREGVKLSFLPFFAKAAVEALKSHPVVNSRIDTEANEIYYPGAEHLGVAVDTERGLLVPVIRDAGDLTIGGLARRIADLAARTRDNKITPDELGGGTFTLTNTGSRGALFDTPIINQPQVAILGTGAVVKRPVVVSHPDLGEAIAVRSMVFLALSYDHRIVDGADAARFLATVKARLEEGAFEADLGL